MSELVSVITLTHNKLEYTRRCLGSLLQTAYSPWELIVVDNGSNDGTPAWLEQFRTEAGSAGIPVEAVLNKDNIGCSTARNHGIACARGKKIVFIDNDVALRSRGWLARLGACLDRDQTRGMVAPKLVYPYPPFVIQCAGGAVSPSGRVQFCGRGEPRDDPRFNRERELQCCISACCIARRGCLEEVGGFDEIFNPVEYEEIDLCYRIRQRGYKIIYTPDVEMYHFEGVTTTGTLSLPNTYLIVKHGLIFKKRWRAMFERENGPPDAETEWRDIPRHNFAEIGELEVVA